MTELARSPKSRFLTLDAMRGIAALFVLTRHFPDPTLPGLFPGSYLAVDMFFVLSGFVLSHAYGWDLAGRMGARAFLLKRVIRLYPLYILGSIGVALGYLLMWVTWQPWGRLRMATSLAGAFVMLPLPDRFAFNIGVAYPLNQPAWSLFWELAVNFVFALFAWTVRRLLGVIAVGAVLLMLLAYHFGTIDVGQAWHSFFGGGCRVVYSFFIGALLYRFQSRWNLRLPAPLLLLVLPLSFLLPASWDLVNAMLLFPLLVFLGAKTEPGPRLEGLFRFLGDISYPVYALHFAIMVAMTYACKLTTGLELKSAGLAGTVAGLAVTIVAAQYAGSRYDPAARKWLTGLTARLARKAARA